MKDWKDGKGTSGAMQKRKLITRSEMEEALAHIEKSNSEMGSVDMRLGRMEGRLEEALPAIQRSVDAIFAKIDKLPCAEEQVLLATTVTEVKGIKDKLKAMGRTRVAITGALLSLLVGIILHLLTRGE